MVDSHRTLTQSQLPRDRFAESCPWRLDQVLDSDFLPES
ncbi:MAG: DUF29 domain-containing protein [Actinomycetota bacterium]|nr:DUF29 domain-containing protein [Actinomycetota bacterium]